MNKHIKRILKITSLSLSTMFCFNKVIDAKLTPVVSSKNNKTYHWKDVDITYSILGDMDKTPLLLLHNLHPSSSKEEWYQIDKALARDYTIYEIDLPGCGKSDKPNETYVNYMFVQLLQDFIKHVIGKKTNVCATAFSSSFTIMTARMNPELFDKIIIINPTSVEELVLPVTKKTEFKKKFFDLPIIGTFAYNCRMTKSGLVDDYKYMYYYNDRIVSSKITDIAYYNAHYLHSNGRFLYGSILGNYTNINVIHSLPLIKSELYLIGNGQYKNIMQEYKKYNENINISYISNCRLLPQLEIPRTIEERILSILQS